MYAHMYICMCIYIYIYIHIIIINNTCYVLLNRCAIMTIAHTN